MITYDPNEPWAFTLDRLERLAAHQLAQLVRDLGIDAQRSDLVTGMDDPDVNTYDWCTAVAKTALSLLQSRLESLESLVTQDRVLTHDARVVSTRYRNPKTGRVIRHVYGPYQTQSRAAAAKKSLMYELPQSALRDTEVSIHKLLGG